MNSTIDQPTGEQETVSAFSFPLAMASKAVPAAEIVVEADFLPETLELIGRATAMVQAKQVITIVSQQEYETSASELLKVKEAAKAIDEKRKSLTKPIDDEKSRIMESVRPYTTALTNAEVILKAGMVAYIQEQERKQQLAEAEAAEERRKKEASIQARAERAEEFGHTEKADVLRQQAMETVVAAPVTASYDAPKASGISTSKVYSAEVTDLKKLVEAVAAGKVSIKALQADMKFLNSMAKTLKDEFADQYPGCKLSASVSMTARGSKK